MLAIDTLDVTIGSVLKGKRMYDRKQLDEPTSSAVHFYHFSDEAENHLHQGLHQQIPQSSLRRGEGSSGGLDKGTQSVLLFLCLMDTLLVIKHTVPNATLISQVL